MAANQELKSLWFGSNGTLGSAEEDSLFYPGELGKTAFVKPSDDKPVPIEVQKVKRYASDTVTAADGTLAFWQDLDDCVVSANPDNAIGTSTNPLVAGVFRGAYPSAGKYGLIQIGGVVSATVGSGTVAAGDAVVAYGASGVAGSVTKAAAPGADTTSPLKVYVGRALATGSTTVKAKIILTLPRFGR